MPSLEALLAYISPDRRHAIAAGIDLPSHVHGTALWADLSGFTPLSETLVHRFGPRHGADELGLYLNYFYNAIIAPVDLYGGSVVDFSGDAITCWFDGDQGQRAIAAAQIMQAAVQPFVNLQFAAGESISLGVKIAIASGSVRRFCVGDPSIQYMDTLAGALIDRLAVVGDMAETGEILLDETMEANLIEGQRIVERRTDPDTGQRAAVLSLDSPFEAPTSIPTPPPTFNEEQIRPWLLPDVFEYIQNGQGEFLTELRPAVALFLRFEGLNYDHEQAAEKLNEVTCFAQRIVFEYEGVLLQLTIGDKGSYLYAAFGAPTSHEDDMLRAATAALKLRDLPNQVAGLDSVCIGLSHGIMRTGGYGGTSRRTYGVLGEDANLAARLMSHAEAGQILVSEAIWQELEADFQWQMLPAVQLKGRQMPIQPAALLGWMEQDMVVLPEVTAAMPMIGRQAELSALQEKLALACQGNGQIVRITGEAGIGKSRLLAEMLQHVDEDEITCYGSECQSYGVDSAYLLWQPIWRAFFDVDPSLTLAEQIQNLDKTLTEVNPDFLLRLPLLDAALNLIIPDNSLTEGMDAKTRKTLREALLADYLRVRVGTRPLILILEDLHWIDPLSLDLLGVIARAIKDLPVLLLLTYRPMVENEAVSFLADLNGLEHLRHIHLTDLAPAEMKELIVSRWSGFGLRGAVSNALLEQLSARTQGNPFYTEELLNYLHDRGLDPRRDSAWAQTDLPDSLHSLILGRIDQLSDRHRITIKAASIIGRTFRASWLYECYPLLGSPTQVSADLDTLSRLELLVQEKPVSPLSYLFKHVITHEVAYQSLSYSTRARLHEQFASYLENLVAGETEQYLDLLAYHYGRSPNLPKKREYLRRAGEAAQKAYANDTAIAYLSRALELAPADDYAERFEILFARQDVYSIIMKREAENEDLIALAALADLLNDDTRRAKVALRRSNYAYFMGDYPEAAEAAQRAVELAHAAGAINVESLAYTRWSASLVRQGNFDESYVCDEKALELAEKIQDQDLIALGLLNFGSRFMDQGDLDKAQEYYQRALYIYRETGHKRNEPVVLYSLGTLHSYYDLAEAENYYEQALASWRSMADRRFEGVALSQFAYLILERRNDYGKARKYCEESLRLCIEVSDRLGEMSTLYSFGFIDLIHNQYLSAQMQLQQALTICREIDYRLYVGACLAKLGTVACQLGNFSQAQEYYKEGIAILRNAGNINELCEALTASGRLYFYIQDHFAASEACREALELALKSKNRLEQTHALTLQGHLLADNGDYDAAVASYRQAFALARELGLEHYAKQAETGLARIASSQGRIDEALEVLEGVLYYLSSHHLSTIDEAAWMYLNCYRILLSASDPRAFPTLEAAYRFLQAIADEMNDPALQASFMQNIRFNRTIFEAWQAETEKG